MKQDRGKHYTSKGVEDDGTVSPLPAAGSLSMVI